MSSYFPIRVQTAVVNNKPVTKLVYNQEQLDKHNYQVAVIDTVSSIKPYLYFSEHSNVSRLFRSSHC